MELSHEALQFSALALAIVSFGLAVVMLVSQGFTRTNSFASGFVVAIAVDVATVPVFVDRVDADDPQVWARLQGLSEVAGLLLGAAYMLGLLASSGTRGRQARIVRSCAWTEVGLAGWHAVAVIAWPVERFNDYMLSLGEPGVFARPGFWLFGVFWIVAAIPYVVGWWLLARGGMDPAENRRAQAFAGASTVVILSTVAPSLLTGVLVSLWICLGMYGQMQYSSAHAQQGVFLSRFLSPHVAELVEARGLAEAMKPHLADITVVSADLRGFTSYSEGVPSQAVVDLLAEYYDAVGEVVARYGGTITNYAGDGVLILVGAPIADPEHAVTGIRLARELLLAVEPVLERWQTRMHTLGLGIGVASGKVTVGAIAAETRMEYTAIGMPVNLAARLCANAAADEVLLDATAAELSHLDDMQPKGEMRIKGFSDLQQVYAVDK